MTYISRSSDFAMYREDYLDGCTSYFGIVSHCDATFVLELNVGHNDLYIVIYFEDYLLDGYHSLG